MSALRIGELCAGYGGLGMAVQQVLGGEVAWVADNDPGASKILAHRLPSAPNYGDITETDWSAVEPVDVLCAGFPCQDLSCAGKRLGLREGNRSGLWFHVARAIAELRPQLVVIENVKELLSEYADSDMEQCAWCLGDAGNERAVRALGAVLGDLATLGFDAEWCSLPAAGVGCCHLRWRVFLIAWPAADADRARRREVAGGAHGHEGADAGWAAQDDHVPGGTGEEWVPAAGRVVAAYTESRGRERKRQGIFGPSGRTQADGCPPADTQSDGRHQRRPEPAGVVRGSDAAICGDEVPPDAQGHSAARHVAIPRDGGGDTRRRPGAGDRVAPANAGSGAGGRWSDAPLGGPQYGTPATGDSPEPSGGGHGRNTPADTLGEGLPVREVEPARDELPAPERGRGDGTGLGVDWREYGPAVRRQEAIFGTAAPWPVEPGRNGPRLAPGFVEWMMNLPAGWVTDVPGLSRNAQLKALGNGVVPAQAAAALRLLLAAATPAAEPAKSTPGAAA